MVNRQAIVNFLESLEVNPRSYPHLLPCNSGRPGLSFGVDRLDCAFIDSQRRRICPECFRDKPWHLRAWQHRWMRTCPEHDLVLVDRCVCGIPLSWRYFERCGCGHPLGQLPAHAAAGRLAFLSQELLGRAIGASTLHPDTRAMLLEDVLYIAFVLGQSDVMMAYERAREQSYPPNINLEELDNGIAVLVDGYNAFKNKMYSIIDRRWKRKIPMVNMVNAKIIFNIMNISDNENFHRWCFGAIVGSNEPIDINIKYVSSRTWHAEDHTANMARWNPDIDKLLALKESQALTTTNPTGT